MPQSPFATLNSFLLSIEEVTVHMDTKEFFTEYGEANRYTIKEVIGKGSYGVVCSAVDIKTGEKVAIKKINNVFDHVSDATRILREIKLLRLLRHPGKRSFWPQVICLNP